MEDSIYFDRQAGQLYWQGKALYAGPQPERSALRKLPEHTAPACLYVLPSPGLGYGVGHLLLRLPPTSRLLLLEADDALARFCCGHLARLLEDDRVAFLSVATTSTSRLEAAIEILFDFLDKNRLPKWQAWGFRRLQSLPLNRAFAMQRALYEPLLRWLEQYAPQFWRNRLTLEQLGPLWLRNLFRNLRQLAHCQPFALPAAGPTKMVLAAAGTSLEQHCDWLRRERPRFTLIAVDTALLPLLKAGIVPDYVVNLDAQILNLQDFYGARPLYRQLPAQGCAGLTMLADLSADPRSFALLNRPFQLTATRFADLRLWHRLQPLLTQIAQLRSSPQPLVQDVEPLGSVGVAALALALKSQSSLLLLVGYDFAYPRDLQHLRGSSIHEKLLRQSHRLAPCNSFASTIANISANISENIPLAKGFVTDRILYGYALQLQNYLRRHAPKHLCCARLSGPLELPQIPAVSHNQASQLLAYPIPPIEPNQTKGPQCAGGQSADSPQAASKNVQRDLDSLLKTFWYKELQILQHVETAIHSGTLLRDPTFWHQSGFAADYLLKLCLPKAGYSEGEQDNWARIHPLALDFSTQLTALLDGEADHAEKPPFRPP